MAVRWTPMMAIECTALVVLWLVIGAINRHYLWTAYLPGCALGLTLCSLQGYFEHAAGTTSHYGRLYNLLFFNDGYHVEHHRRPTLHWSKLQADSRRESRSSRWPPVLRWLEWLAIWRRPLNGLEAVVLYVPWLQRVVLRMHGRALSQGPRRCRRPRPHHRGGRRPLSTDRAAAASDLPPCHHYGDRRERRASRAREALLPDDVRAEQRVFDGRTTVDADLVVIPLAFVGDREAIYAHPPAPLVLVHDWIWRPRGRTLPISLFLLKRLNVIVRHAS